MEETVLLGRGRELVSASAREWREKLRGAPAHIAPRLAFMGAEHHRVRNFAVSQLPRRGGEALPPGDIARALGLSPKRCEAILEELEHNLSFLVRDGLGQVAWAFPVTDQPTPHRLKFSSGEALYGA